MCYRTRISLENLTKKFLEVYVSPLLLSLSSDFPKEEKMSQPMSSPDIKNKLVNESTGGQRQQSEDINCFK